MSVSTGPPTRRKTVYQLLKPYVLPKLEAYRDDFLKHDLRWLRDHPGVPFIHMTRSTGTNLVPLYPAGSFYYPARGVVIPYLFGFADRHHLLKDVTSVVDCSPLEHSFLYCDGSTVRQITHEQAQQIRLEHIATVERQWRAGR